jgi:hypothetical protein
MDPPNNSAEISFLLLTKDGFQTKVRPRISLRGEVRPGGANGSLRGVDVPCHATRDHVTHPKHTRQ